MVRSVFFLVTTLLYDDWMITGLICDLYTVNTTRNTRTATIQVVGFNHTDKKEGVFGDAIVFKYCLYLLRSPSIVLSETHSHVVL